MTTHYTNSKGERVEIATMAYTHLKNAHAKAERDLVDKGGSVEREAEIAAMAQEIRDRDDQFARRVDDLRERGYREEEDASLDKSPFLVRDPEGEIVGRGKDENAAWWAALEKDAQRNGRD